MARRSGWRKAGSKEGEEKINLNKNLFLVDSIVEISQRKSSKNVFMEIQRV